MDSVEFLSGLTKNDKLIPIITIVILWNENDWDGPKDIMDLLDKTNPNIIKYINNYKLNLIVPSEIKDFSNFKSSFGKVMEFLNKSKDKEQLKRLLETKKDFYSNMDAQIAYLLKEVSGIKIKMQKNREGGIDMCKAFQQMKQDAIKEGEERFAKLIKRLSEDNKNEEITKIATDKKLRERLFKEYKL